ncbi:MAG: ribonuclease III [Oscillospiraceae bacterium]|nr:ribonuclease III [Oscillospiraceae bacterium]MBR6678492.1 ribonuclease III [Oscillospiraceae bacterium]
MRDHFHIKLTDDTIREISSIGLAHLGDAVYELLVRAWLCEQGKATGKGLHRATVEMVKAPAQAARVERILPLLSEEEMGVFRRGRNANVHNIPRNASRSDYQKATALEALFGYLYLQNKQERINELFDQMLGEEE